MAAPKRCRWLWAGLWAGSVLLGSSSLAQNLAGQVAAIDAGRQATSGAGFRQLAPGIERTINPETKPEETFSRQDLVGLLKRKPDYGQRPWDPRNLAKDVRLEHQPWALQFTLKPVGFLTVDVPKADGTLEQKVVWYLVYYVKNTSDQPVRFIPRFILHAQEPNRYYPDRLIPVAQPLVQRREDPRRTLLNSVEISDIEIPPAQEGQEAPSVWGVATWTDIDPKTDRFSIYVQGLTNAYRIEATETGDWRFLRKTLQLNFWRPGDEFYEHEAEIRLGAPGDVDYRWVYK